MKKLTVSRVSRKQSGNKEKPSKGANRVTPELRKKISQIAIEASQDLSEFEAGPVDDVRAVNMLNEIAADLKTAERELTDALGDSVVTFEIKVVKDRKAIARHQKRARDFQLVDQRRAAR